MQDITSLARHITILDCVFGILFAKKRSEIETSVLGTGTWSLKAVVQLRLSLAGHDVTFSGSVITNPEFNGLGHVS